MTYKEVLQSVEYMSHDAYFDYEQEVRMTKQEILVMAEREAERRGIEITIPAVLEVGDLEEIVWTFDLYGADEIGEEIKNRYIHAELLAA